MDDRHFGYITKLTKTTVCQTSQEQDETATKTTKSGRIVFSDLTDKIGKTKCVASMSRIIYAQGEGGKGGEGEDKIPRQHSTRDQDHTQSACGQSSKGSFEIGDCTSFCVARSRSSANRNCLIFKCGTAEIHGSCSSLLSLHHDFVLRLRWVCFEGLFGDSGSRGEEFRFATRTAQGQSYRLYPQ